jgi:hypothetical protein
MILIASAALITKEFEPEIGRIPPSFLPLGNKRLYEHQARSLRESFPDEKIYISLPSCYSIPAHDRQRLKQLDLVVLPVPADFTLGQSILYCVKNINVFDETFRELHGDTLIERVPGDVDLIGLGKAKNNYEWEVEHVTETEKMVWCGFFAFSNVGLLIESLSKSGDSFSAAIRNYSSIKNLATEVIDTWNDLGHINTYYQTRAKFTTERSFNSLSIVDGTVLKTSPNSVKILAEVMWWSSLPPKLKKHAPQLLDHGEISGKAFYLTEYVPHLTLSELFVFGNLPTQFWGKISKLVDNVLADFVMSAESFDESEVHQDHNRYIRRKTISRVRGYLASSSINLFNKEHNLNGVSLPSLEEILEDCFQAIEAVKAIPAVLHGDLCFSNILFDSRSEKLKLIDPRGISAPLGYNLVGDLNYDIAKFAHSAVGLYDFIIADRYDFAENRPLEFRLNFELSEVQTRTVNRFLLSSLLGRKIVEVLPTVVTLFFSMLPLHADSPRRQRALYANALRIYEMWKRC